MFGSGIQLGTLGEWFGGIAAAAAFVWAVRGWRQERKIVAEQQTFIAGEIARQAAERAERDRLRESIAQRPGPQWTWPSGNGPYVNFWNPTDDLLVNVRLAVSDGGFPDTWTSDAVGPQRNEERVFERRISNDVQWTVEFTDGLGQRWRHHRSAGRAVRVDHEDSPPTT